MCFAGMMVLRCLVGVAEEQEKNLSKKILKNLEFNSVIAEY